MELKNLRGLDEDLNQGIKYNKKHGGVSDALRRIKKRPEDPNWRLNAMREPMKIQETNKCKCGTTKFKYQKVCYKCYGKKYAS